MISNCHACRTTRQAATRSNLSKTLLDPAEKTPIPSTSDVLSQALASVRYIEYDQKRLVGFYIHFISSKLSVKWFAGT